MQETLSEKIATLIEQSRLYVAQVANTAMVQTYYKIGEMLVEELQNGATRAEYGVQLLQKVGRLLTKQFGKGFSETNLKQMRDFYTAYSIRQTVSDEWQWSSVLSWSHYLLLMRIQNPAERQFYELEAHQNQWSVRTLQRQFNSGLYERLLLSRDKSAVQSLAQVGQVIQKPHDLLKEPLVLEFLGLEDKNQYSESELETAIINQLEKFMLELGKGFLFGGRQVRFTFDEDHFKVDLVFYNRFLQCFVLIDLKIGKLTHQDLGQMQMYVNYYDRYVKLEHENPTVGIIICKDKNQSLVEITLPKDNQQIFAQKYQTVLPSKEVLKALLEKYNE
jgi:predicted nuclease of restriction endonuclease-like (RecB) superfamily